MWLYCYYNFVAQVERERADEIERDNHTLLTKMQRIMSTQGSVEHRNTYRHHRYACNCSLALIQLYVAAPFTLRSGRGTPLRRVQ